MISDLASFVRIPYPLQSAVCAAFRAAPEKKKHRQRRRSATGAIVCVLIWKAFAFFVGFVFDVFIIRERFAFVNCIFQILFSCGYVDKTANAIYCFSVECIRKFCGDVCGCTAHRRGRMCRCTAVSCESARFFGQNRGLEKKTASGGGRVWQTGFGAPESPRF